jgi:hypothetical protein
LAWFVVGLRTGWSLQPGSDLPALEPTPYAAAIDPVVAE